MIKNRFFKNTLGIFAEVIVATGVDDNETASDGAHSVIDVPLTIAATPTAGDTVKFTVDGAEYEYTVPATNNSTAQVVAGIVAMLNSNDQGFAVEGTGTTSAIFTFSHPDPTWNGNTISLVEVGTTFTAAGPYTFAGGVAADAAAADSMADFVDDAAAGEIWAFWDDTNLALKAGDTAKAANIDRKFFYAWKEADGTTKRTAAIPVRGRVYNSAAYSAGTAQVRKAVFGGTISAGQWIHIRIIETTGGHQHPFPAFSYSVKAGSSVDDAVTALAAAINAEASKNDPVATASASTNELTVTGVSKTRSFQLVAHIEVTAAQPTDASDITLTEVTPLSYPVGDAATVAELVRYSNLNQGGVEYTSKIYSPEEFGQIASNLNAATQYGLLLVTSDRSEQGIVHNAQKRAYVLIALPNANLATLAAL